MEKILRKAEGYCLQKKKFQEGAGTLWEDWNLRRENDDWSYKIFIRRRSAPSIFLRETNCRIRQIITQTEQTVYSFNANDRTEQIIP